MDSINEILMQLAHDNIKRYDTVDPVLLEKIYEKMEDMLYITITNGKIVDYKHERVHWSFKCRVNGYINLLSNTLEMFPNNNFNFKLIINIYDIPRDLPIFNFCRFPKQKTFLFPNFRFGDDDIILDNEFNNERKWSNTRDYLMNYPKEFNEKLNKFYMSGTNNPAKIGYFNFALDNLDICDFYIVNDPQCKIPPTIYNRFIELGKISKDYYQFKNYKENLDYKYLIYTDGNTLSDRMRLYLNSKSITFMHRPEYEEYYSPLLSNMENYILFNDYSKLNDLKLMVENNDKLINTILHNNKMFNELFLTPRSIYKYISYTLENYAKIFQ